MKRLIAASLVLGLVAACAPPAEESQESPPDLPSLAMDRDRPQLALADHLLANYFASDVAMRPTVCIATTDGRDDVALEAGWERELMSRYEALAPFSRCALLDGVWRDAETGEPAMVFTLHTFTCTDELSCNGFGGYMAGATSSMSSRYTLQWDRDRWLFTRDDRLLGDQ